jgi:hypothetical protein
MQKVSNGQLPKAQDIPRQEKGSQFDWTGLLANMLQENLKPKKSTCAAALDDGHETLDSKPYNSKKAEKI